MDVIVTFEDEMLAPGVSLLQLRGLFEDHPTPALVVAMCQQAGDVESPGELIRALYVDEFQWLDVVNELEWLEEHFGWRQKMCVEVGVNRWLNA